MWFWLAWSAIVVNGAYVERGSSIKMVVLCFQLKGTNFLFDGLQ